MNDAVIVTPEYTAVTVTLTGVSVSTVSISNVVVDDPAGTVTVEGSVANALLLVIVIAAPPDGATALRATVPVTGDPATTDVAVTLTEASVAVEVGDGVVDVDPVQAAAVSAAESVRTTRANRLRCNISR